ncbi:MAG: diacylglycerol kinase [Parcubacteria group bacterium Athens0714_12]|nr:MAG: diacylglycerol kinase [Parcubacteria group bacterium Athens0714_12]
MANFKRFFKSFHNAFKGLSHAFRYEQSFQFQIVVAVLVLILAFYFKLKVWEKISLVLVISSVLVLELINTVFEKLSDILKPRIHHYIKDIKDILAGTVLIATIAAIIIGLLIFMPYFF